MGSDASLLSALVTIAFGALAGGLTNAVAIWMLFHPYTPRGLWRMKIQGAIPKNKPRLAKTIGRTVGERLLTSEDLAKQLSTPGLRQAFDDAVRSFVVGLLDTERKSLREELSPTVVADLESAFAPLGATIADRLTEYAATEQFRTNVASMQLKVTDDLADRPISDFLTVARRESIRNRVEGWIEDASVSPGLHDAIGAWLDRQATQMGQDRTPLLERLPTSLVAAVEGEIAGYIPMAIDRIGAVLTDPSSRQSIQRHLHKVFQGFVENLLIHERIVARLVVTEKTIARLLENVEDEGVDKVVTLFEEPEMRSQVAKSVNDAVVKFLRRPLADHIATLGPERVEGIKATARQHIVAALQDGATRAYALEKVDKALDAAEGKTWSDLLRYIPAEDTAEWLAAAIGTPRVREWISDGSSLALTHLLDRPIGKPADRLPEGSVDRIAVALSPVIWDWIQQQVPKLVAQLDIQQTVEEKVLGFSLERIEEIVRRTTQRELDLIVRLGYALGAIVGAIAYAVSRFLS